MDNQKPLERIKKESRKHPRVAVYMSVSASNFPVLEDYTISSHNISLSGIMLVVTPTLKPKAEIQIGDRVTLTFLLSSKSGPMNIPAQIAWVKERVLTPENQEASCLGLKFIEISSKTEQTIEGFLKSGPEGATVLKSQGKTCRDCINFKENVGSKYAFCKLHKITILNSSEDMTLSFNQIYSHPCKDLKLKE